MAFCGFYSKENVFCRKFSVFSLPLIGSFYGNVNTVLVLFLIPIRTLRISFDGNHFKSKRYSNQPFLVLLLLLIRSLLVIHVPNRCLLSVRNVIHAIIFALLIAVSVSIPAVIPKGRQYTKQNESDQHKIQIGFGGIRLYYVMFTIMIINVITKVTTPTCI